jgi:hypothetical protein
MLATAVAVGLPVPPDFPQEGRRRRPSPQSKGRDYAMNDEQDKQGQEAAEGGQEADKQSPSAPPGPNPEDQEDGRTPPPDDLDLSQDPAYEPKDESLKGIKGG